MADPIPLAVVGCKFGRHIVKSLTQRDHGVRVVGVCDLNAELAQRVADEYGVRTYPDLAAVLADDQVLAVGLFTGPVGRAELIESIVDAGRHVLTTKPFALHPAEAERALAAADRAGRVLHLNSPGPLPSEDLALIARWRAEHDLGAPVGARAETWATYRESADGTWYDDPERCPVAPVLRLGVYLVNDLVRIFGPADAVQVLATRLRTGRPTPDNAQLGIQFRNGALAAVFASFCVDDGQVYPDALVLNFENGTIRRVTRRNPTAPLAAPSTELTLTMAGQAPERVTVSEASGAYQWDAFVRAVHGGPPATPAEVLVDGVAVLDAMARADHSGGIERVLR